MSRSSITNKIISEVVEGKQSSRGCLKGDCKKSTVLKLGAPKEFIINSKRDASVHFHRFVLPLLLLNLQPFLANTPARIFVFSINFHYNYTSYDGATGRRKKNLFLRLVQPRPRVPSAARQRQSKTNEKGDYGIESDASLKFSSNAHTHTTSVRGEN